MFGETMGDVRADRLMINLILVLARTLVNVSVGIPTCIGWMAESCKCSKYRTAT